MERDSNVELLSRDHLSALHTIKPYLRFSPYFFQFPVRPFYIHIEILKHISTLPKDMLD